MGETIHIVSEINNKYFRKKKEKKKPSGSEGGSQLAVRFNTDQSQTLLIYRSVYELMHVNGPQKDITKL